MLFSKLIQILCFTLIRKFKSILGSLAFIIIIYLGFFGSEKYNIEPFIKKWLSNENTKEIVSKIKETIIDR